MPPTLSLPLDNWPNSLERACVHTSLFSPFNRVSIVSFVFPGYIYWMEWCLGWLSREFGIRGIGIGSLKKAGVEESFVSEY